MNDYRTGARMNDRFEFNGLDLPIFDHAYNTTVLNERAIEIPIALQWLHQNGHGRGLEVGNVIGHYFEELGEVDDRRIVDKYETGVDGVENIDLFDIHGEFDYIFAISTVEHVRWDPPEERDLNGASMAIDHLRSLLSADGKMLITIPFGSHPVLDASILIELIEPKRSTVMMRSGGLWHENTSTGRWECRGSSWYQASTVWWERYGKSTPWADAVWIGEFE